MEEKIKYEYKKPQKGFVIDKGWEENRYKAVKKVKKEEKTNGRKEK